MNGEGRREEEMNIEFGCTPRLIFDLIGWIGGLSLLKWALLSASLARSPPHPPHLHPLSFDFDLGRVAAAASPFAVGPDPPPSSRTARISSARQRYSVNFWGEKERVKCFFHVIQLQQNPDCFVTRTQVYLTTQGRKDGATGNLSRFVKVNVSTIKNLAEASFFDEAAHSIHDVSGSIAKKFGVTAPPDRMDSQAKYGALARGVGAMVFMLSSSRLL